jgi:glutaredoxin 3
MKKIEIYTGDNCYFCDSAKRLLNKKNYLYNEINISSDELLRHAMVKRANGKRTVPQIFINDIHIGGCNELHNLDRENKLDKIMNTRYSDDQF